MGIEIHRQLTVSPEAVISAIRANTREWRESWLPEDVRSKSVIGVTSRVSHNKFRLFYERRWYPRGGDPLQLRGSVTPGPNGGCIVDARCGTRGSLGWVM